MSFNQILELIQKFSTADYMYTCKGIEDSPFSVETILDLLSKEVIDPIILRQKSEIRKIKILNLFDKDEILYLAIFENIAIFIGQESERLNVYDEVQNLLVEINEMDMKTTHKTE